MRDKNLELQIKRLKEFMQLWITFHDMYKSAIKRETITPEEEQSFLETKSLIARKYQALKDQLKVSSNYEYRTFDVISQVLSLKSVAAISDLSLNKIENDWHNSYIVLNKLLGELEGKQEELRKVSALGLMLKKFFGSPLGNLLMIVVIIAGIYFALVVVRNMIFGKPRQPESMIEFRGEEEGGQKPREMPSEDMPLPSRQDIGQY